MDQCLEKESEVSSSGGCSSPSRTILWCVPRSGSTALTKCLSAIDGIETWFEPYTFCRYAEVGYKNETGVDLPSEFEGNEEAYAWAKQLLDTATAHVNSVPVRLAYTTVKRDLENGNSEHSFVKDMGHGLADDKRKFLPKGYKHTFLIRNPLQYIHSYRKSVVGLKSKEGGVLQGNAAEESTFDLERDHIYWPPGCYMKELYDLWMYVKEAIDSDPVVIDTEDLLIKPKETLSRYCSLVGLPYHDGLLQWKASAEGCNKMKACSDDLLEKLDPFFGTAMKSTCFSPPSELPPRDQITPDVIRCSEKVINYFNEMYDTRLKV